MEKSWIPIVVGLVALLVGWVIGFFDSNLRTAKKIHEAEARAKFEVEQAHKLAKGSEPAEAKPGLLRLAYDEGQKPRLELDGQIVRPKKLTTEQGKRLAELLTLMKPWTEGLPGTAPQTAPAAAPAPAPDRPIMVPAVAVAAGVAAPERPAPATGNRMIDQINAILQKKLAGTPLEQKGIRLQESLTGALWIYVGLKRYDGIEAVPEKEIQAAIREAVAEWDRSNL